MKRIYAGLTIACVIAAFGAFTGALQMIQRSPGLDLAGAFQVVLISGDAVPGLVVAVAALILMAFARRLKDHPASRIVVVVAWIAALLPLGLAGWKIYRVLDIMRMIEEKAGSLAFYIRAPGYAELMLIAATALFGAALAFGVLKLLAPGDALRAPRSR